jgi:hypothetical protein
MTKISFTCLRPSESVGDAVAVMEPETETLPVDVAVRVDTEDAEAAAVLTGSDDWRETSLGFCEVVAAKVAAGLLDADVDDVSVIGRL